MGSRARSGSGLGARRAVLGALLAVVLIAIVVILAAQLGDRPGEVGGAVVTEPAPHAPEDGPASPETSPEEVAEPQAEAGPPSPTAVATPLLVGKPVADAQRLLANAGMTYREDERGAAPHHTIPRGHVIWQEPGPSEVASPGAAVTVRLSLGPPVTVPTDLEDRQYEDAKTELEARGLRVTRREERRPGAPQGVVLRTAPPGGTEVAGGSTVSLYVNAAPAPRVPNVIGMSESEARQALGAAGFQVAEPVNARHHDQVPAGIVMNADPAAGTQTEPETAITLAVSLGPQPAPVATTGHFLLRATSEGAGRLHFCVFRPQDDDFEPLWTRLTPGGEWRLELSPGEYQVAAYTDFRDTAGAARWARAFRVRPSQTTTVVFRR